MDRLREGKISKILLARIHISVLCLDRMSLVLWFPVVLRVGKSGKCQTGCFCEYYLWSSG